MRLSCLVIPSRLAAVAVIALLAVVPLPSRAAGLLPWATGIATPAPIATPIVTPSPSVEPSADAVDALPPAGTIAPETRVTITGDPADPAFVFEQAQFAALRAASLQPGATIRIGGVEGVRDALPVGKERLLTVPVTITAPEMSPVHALTNVTVQNLASPYIVPRSLVVSDEPEYLTASGTLLTATIAPGTAARFFSYHENVAGQPARRLRVRVTNLGDAPSVLSMEGAYGGPSSDVFAVGHSASRRFLLRSLPHEGRLLTLAPHSTALLRDDDLPAGTVGNAIFELADLQGPPLQVDLSAEHAVGPLRPLAPPTAAGIHDRHARGIYPLANLHATFSYAPDQPPVIMPVGGLALPNTGPGLALGGDYGVFFAFTVEVHNPTDDPLPIALYINPRSGRVTGTFAIDRSVVSVHALPALAHPKLWEGVVQAHASGRLEILTMPEGGSSYPLNLVLGPDDGSSSPGSPRSPVYSESTAL